MLSISKFKNHTQVHTCPPAQLRFGDASQWLLVIAQPLLLPNWIAGFLNLLVFIPFYFLRVKAEEQMMLDSFGTQYQEYMKRTGGVLPKL